jgi:hypothetical protein
MRVLFQLFSLLSQQTDDIKQNKHSLSEYIGINKINKNFCWRNPWKLCSNTVIIHSHVDRKFNRLSNGNVLVGKSSS